MKIFMHGYTFRAYPFEKALRKAAEYGYDGIELTGPHMNPDDLSGSIERACELAGKIGMAVGAVPLPGNFISDDPEQTNRAIETCAAVIRAAGKHGIRIANGSVGSLVGPNPQDFGANGSALASENHYKQAAEALRELVPVCDEHDVTITFEIHMNTIHDTAATTKKLIEMVGSPRLEANPDPGNMHATPQAEPPANAIEILDGMIGYFHFKNCRLPLAENSYSCLLSGGDIDIFKVVEKLVGSGYEGPVCIEYCGQGDPRPAAQQDIIYLRDCLREILG